MALEKVDDHIKELCKKDPKFKRSYKEFKEMLDIYRKGYGAEIEELQARAEKAEGELAKLRNVEKINYCINMFVKKNTMRVFDLTTQSDLAQAIVTYLKEGVI